MGRNLYLNGTYAEAKSKGFDICQLKMDGWYCTANHSDGQAVFFSETSRQFGTATIPSLDGCTLIGEFMRGTQWSQHPDRKGRFYIFDITTLYGTPLISEPYIARYKLLRKLRLPSSYSLVDTYRIDDQPAIWERYVLREGWEGVVYRRSTSTLDDAILREKREYSLDGVVVGFEPGLGKYEGTLGAIRVAVGEANTCSIGGGFTDAERAEIWNNQTAFLGRVAEFTANAIFDSGAPRHPRFVRWREDKI